MSLEQKYLQLFKGTRAAGVDITFAANDAIRASVVVVKKKRKKIEIVATHTGIDSLERLLSVLNPSIPVYLTVNGKGVLHKKMAALPDDDGYTKTVLKAFSSINPDDFIVGKQPLGEGVLFLSLVRKDVVASLVNTFMEKGIYVVGIAIDPFAIGNLHSFFTNSGGIVIPGYCIRMGDGLIADVDCEEIEPLVERSYHIGGEVIDSRNLLAFASSLNLFLSQGDLSQEYAEVAVVQQEFLFKQAVLKSGAIALVFFFVLLLGNFLLFSHYKEKVRAKGDVYNQYVTLVQQLKVMEADLHSRDSFFGEHGLLKSSRMSFYADRLVACMPNTVILDDLSLCPLAARGISDGDVKFKPDEIKVVGTTSSSSDLNFWFEHLQTLPWIKQVKLTGLEQIAGLRQTNFELVITLK